MSRIPDPTIRDGRLSYELVCRYKPCSGEFRAGRCDAQYCGGTCRKRASIERIRENRS